MAIEPKAISELDEVTESALNVDEAWFPVNSGAAPVTKRLSGRSLMRKVLSDDYSIFIRGTNTTADNDAITAAVAQINTWGAAGKRGEIVFIGDCRITSAHKLNYSCTLRGDGRNSRLIVDHTASYYTVFSFGDWPDSNSGAATGFDVLNNPRTYSILDTGRPFASYFEPDPGVNPSLTFERGEWVILFAENSLAADIEPHGGGSPWDPRPMEIHQIAYWDDSAKRAYVEGFICDQLATTPKVVKLDRMLRDVVVKDLYVEHEGVQGEYQNLCIFKKCNGLRVENMHMDRSGPGNLWATFSANTKIQGLVIEGSERAELVYGTTAGVVNGFLLQDSRLLGCRHPFTTTPGTMPTGPQRAYGMALNVIIDNNSVECYTKVDYPTEGSTTSRDSISTHQPGWGVVIQNNTINVAADKNNSAIVVRSRNCIIRNNHLRSGYSRIPTPWATVNSYGIQVIAKGTQILNNSIEGFYYGVYTRTYDVAANQKTDGTVIDGNTFSRMNGAACAMLLGNNHRISNNNFHECGDLGGAYSQIIELNAGTTGHRIFNNQLAKRYNLYSINTKDLAAGAVEIYGNVMTGYGAGAMGIQGDNEVTIEATYSSKNITDGVTAADQAMSRFGVITSAGAISYHTTLAAAAAVAVSGDTITVPVGGEAMTAAVTFTQDNLRIVGAPGLSRLYRATSTTAMTHAINLTGDNCTCYGVVFDGLGTGTNASAGGAFRSDGDCNVFEECQAINLIGSSATTLYGFFTTGADNVVKNCLARNFDGYGYRSTGTDGLVVNCLADYVTVSLEHNGSVGRCFTVDGFRYSMTAAQAASGRGRMRIDGGTGAAASKRVSLRNVDLELGDLEVPAGTGGLYFENFDFVDLDNVRVYHTGAGANIEPSISFAFGTNHANLSKVYTSGDIQFTDTSAIGYTADAGSNVITKSSHGLVDGDMLQMFNSTPADLPGGVFNYKYYYVINASGGTFKISETKGGSEVDITSAGTGSHTAYRALQSLIMRDCQVGVDYATTNSLFLNAHPRVFGLYNCVFHRCNSIHLRILGPCDGQSIHDTLGCVFYNYGSGGIYVHTSYFLRSGAMLWEGNQLIQLAAGSIAVVSNADQAKIMATRGVRNIFQGTVSAPATSAVFWQPGDIWTQLNAAAGAINTWQNVATSPGNATWKAMSTLAA